MHGNQKKPALTKFYSLFKLTALCAFFLNHEAAALPQAGLRPPLTTGEPGWGGCGAGGCGLCEGDCDNDWDCIVGGGLQCFHRNALESVPGCSGDGVAMMDYCIRTDGHTMELSRPPPLTTGGRWMWRPVAGCGAGKCNRCEGDCDSDSDCKAGLQCFHRNALESVPGCSGDGMSGMDYCIISPPPLTVPLGVDGWRGCSYDGAGKCDLCQGHCNDDRDCKAGLYCFRRHTLESVPGCSDDGVEGMDYCIPLP